MDSPDAKDGDGSRSEHRLHAIIESAPVAMVLAARDGSIRLFNAEAERIFGYAREIVLSRPVEILMPERYRQAHNSLRTGFFHAPEARAMGAGRDLYARRQDGSEFPVEIGLTPLQMGDESWVLSTIVDISARKESEKRLARSERNLQAIVESAPVAMVMVEPSGNIELFNAEAERIFGYTRDEVFNRPVEMLLPERYRVAHANIRASYFQSPEARVMGAGRELFARRKDGSELPVEIGLTPVEMEGETWALSTIVDISARKKSEQAMLDLNQSLSQQVEERTRDLLLARDAAEAASQAKSEFLANMSHEIRTPMNGVIGMSELLSRTGLVPEQRRYLDLVRQSADSLLVLINDILDFSKIEAGKLELFPVEFDLRETLGVTLQSLGYRAAEKGVELAYRVAPEIPPSLVGDSGRLRQIVVNLVGNAIKFTDSGEIVAEATLQSRENGHAMFHFLVRDTGCGVPSEKLETIFQPFTQADSSARRRFGGTGLGLSISRQLAELMHGRMWMESKTGIGTTVHFTARLGVGAGNGTTYWAPPRSLYDLRVLVVDDNTTNRLILAEMLRYWKMRPFLAQSGAEALELLEVQNSRGEGQGADPVRLILLDMVMPGMDGEKLAGEIHARWGIHAPKMLILSSLGQLIPGSKLTELGVGQMLTKPVPPSQLLDAIARTFGTSSGDPQPDQATLTLAERSLRVLLAEDNAVNRLVAVRLLEDRGHSVVAVEDGSRALRAVQEESFDVVLMDVQMPEMDGITAAKGIRNLEKAGTLRRRIPIVALTADAMPSDRERCLLAGMDGYVSKPVRSAELYAALEQTVVPDPESNQPGGFERSSLNLEPLRQLSDDPALVRELVDLFQADWPQLLESAESAFSDGDGQALHRFAHTIKGMLGNFTAEDPFLRASELTDLTRDGHTPPAAGALLQELRKQTERLSRDLKNVRPAADAGV